MTTRASVDITRMIKKLDLTANVMREEGVTLINQASQLGAEVARYQLDVATSPWGFTRMSMDPPQGNSPGRNDTGNMIRTLTATPDNSKTRQRATFGWRQAIIAAFPYIKYQEEGFNNVRSGKWQAGVLALKDGQKYVREQLPRLERNMKARIRRRMK